MLPGLAVEVPATAKKVTAGASAAPHKAKKGGARAEA